MEIYFLQDIVLTTSGFCIADWILGETSYFKRDNARWYLMHTVTNAYVVLYTFNDMLSIVLNPLIDINMQVSQPLTAVLCLHLYHIIRFFNRLTFDDWWHHIFNCFFVIGLIWYYKFGILVNYFFFYMCGLPGGIDYFMLTLNEVGLITRLTEKRVNKYLNMWIRLPGIIYGNVIGWVGYCLGYMTQYSSNLLSLIGFLNLFNAIYFASLVTENVGRYKAKLE